MNTRLRIFLIFVVVVYAVIAVRMIRQKKLKLNYALLWIFTAVMLMLAIAFPTLVFALAHALGIVAPINIALLLFAFFSMLLLFSLTSIISKVSDQNRALCQTIALLEKRIRDVEQKEKEEESGEKGER